MSLQDEELCEHCTHPRHNHNGTHLKDSRTACTKRLGNEASGRQITCSCRKFREVRPGSPSSRRLEEAGRG